MSSKFVENISTLERSNLKLRGEEGLLLLLELLCGCGEQLLGLVQLHLQLLSLLDQVRYLTQTSSSSFLSIISTLKDTDLLLCLGGPDLGLLGLLLAHIGPVHGVVLLHLHGLHLLLDGVHCC